MKINIKESKNIRVSIVRTIGFKTIQTINFMDVNRNSLMGDNIKVKRI